MKILLVSASVIVCNIFANTMAVADPISAKEVIKHSFELYRKGIVFEREVLEMSVSGKMRPTVEKIVVRAIRYGEYGVDGEPRDRAVLRVKKSDRFGEEGLELHIARKPGNDFLETNSGSRGHFRAISGHREDAYFAFTDITRRDAVQVLGENVGGYHYAFLENTPKQSSWVVVAKAKKDTIGVYSKRIFFIGENFAIKKVEYYQDKTLQKDQTNGNIEFWKNGRWQPNTIVFENHQLSRKTVIHITQRAFPEYLNISFLSGG